MADISQRGIVLTGGGSLLYGLERMLAAKLGIDVVVADDAISCVAIGTGKALGMLDKFAALSASCTPFYISLIRESRPVSAGFCLYA